MARGALLVLLVAFGVQTAVAQVYRYVDENGVTVLTNIKPDRSRYPEAVNVGCYGTCIRGVDWHATPLRHDQFVEEVAAATERFGLDPALVRAIMHAESWFNPMAVSHAGAQGLMQLMPATARHYGVADPFDPLQNVIGGAAYLADLLRRYEGDWQLAVAAYNAGETAVAEYQGVPPYAETREYLRRVGILRDRYRVR
jgi:soluble lytic murein transglycosylase-like protein